jgi:hypothetical protein
MQRFFKRLLVALGLGIVALIVLVIWDYTFLWQPSLEGKCVRQSARSHLAHFRGEVVGKHLWILQYRWLRRRFAAVGTKLTLVRILPSTVYDGNIVRHGEKVGDVVIGKSGRFDFGDLPPGEYDLTVSYSGKGDDDLGFGFVIDPSARSSDLLIDASPAESCNCCGGDFEPR